MIPNPKLIRFVRPRRLQLWCAQHGVLTGRWSEKDIQEIRHRAHERMLRFRESLSDEDKQEMDRVNRLAAVEEHSELSHEIEESGREYAEAERALHEQYPWTQFIDRKDSAYIAMVKAVVEDNKKKDVP